MEKDPLHAGRELLAQGKPQEACKAWSDSLRSTNMVLDRRVYSPDSQENVQLISMKVSLLLNMTLAEMKLENWNVAARYCKEVLLIDNVNPKAIYRISLIEAQLNNPETALSWVSKAKTVYPANRDFLDLELKVRAILADNKKQEAKIWGGILRTNTRSSLAQSASACARFTWLDKINICCKRRWAFK